MDSKKIKNLCVSLSISLASVLVLSACLEAGLRIYDPLKMNDLGLSDKPAANPNLLRSEVPKEAKKPGEIRVLALGDSYTWGDGIAETGNTWPSLLEKELKGLYPDKYIKVINLGVCGFTTMNELESLVRIGQRLSPDLVIIEYLINDILPSGRNFTRVGEDWLFAHKPRNIIADQGVDLFLKKHSYLYAFINERYMALQRMIWPPRTWDELYDERSASWDNYRKVLGALGSWQAQQKIPVVFVLFPNFHYGVMTEENFTYRDIYARVASCASSSGLGVYDLMPEFAAKKQDGRTWMVSMSNGHPNERANQLIAQWISRYLKEHSLVK